MSSEQPKEYCEHWVVCKHAHALLYCPVDATGKHHKECEYDTRSRPHPAPAPKCNQFVPIRQDEYDYLMKGWGNEHTEQIDEDVRQRQAAEINCCNCGVPKTSDGEPDCNECAFSEEHDAAIARQAREDVLKDIETFCKTNVVPRASEQWDSGYNTGMGDVLNRCKSLRSTEAHK